MEFLAYIMAWLVTGIVVIYGLYTSGHWAYCLLLLIPSAISLKVTKDDGGKTDLGS